MAAVLIRPSPHKSRLRLFVVQVLFVTVDPKRDTPALLAQYVRAEDRRFVDVAFPYVDAAGQVQGVGLDRLGRPVGAIVRTFAKLTRAAKGHRVG